MKTAIALLACALVCPVAFAAPPVATHLSVQATDIRQLEFNYDAVPGVASYELWFRAAPGAQWVKYSEKPAGSARVFRIGVPVHLLDWRQARYYVNACNPSGCTASNQVGVDGEQLVAMGYLKPPTSLHEWFGSRIAASADGKTLAVLTSETFGSVRSSAAVRVYRKTTATSGWRAESRLVPSTPQSGTGGPNLGDEIALSADGNLLAFGVWTEHVPNVTGGARRGAVYLFGRTGTSWRLTQKIIGSGGWGEFGYQVKVDDAGRTLVVSQQGSGEDGSRVGTIGIYRDPENGSDQFVHVATLAPPDTYNSGCQGIALSGDGNTLLRGCTLASGLANIVQVLKAPDFTESSRLPGGTTGGYDITYDGTVFLAQDENYANVWKLGPSGWVSDGWISGIALRFDDDRRHIAISRDGKIAAYGIEDQSNSGLGPVYPPYQYPEDGSGPNGGVVVYERKSSGWVVRRLVKPGSTHRAWAGHSVALGDNGRIMFVGAPLDPSAATGIDGDRDDVSALQRGAVWIY
jgi:hypothetical protein